MTGNPEIKITKFTSTVKNVNFEEFSLDFRKVYELSWTYESAEPRNILVLSFEKFEQNFGDLVEIASYLYNILSNLI